MTAPGAMSRMAMIPPGRNVGELLPQFAGVQQEAGPIGTPCRQCAGCSKPFTTVRKPRLSFKLYPVHAPVPVAFVYSLCGACRADYRSEGERRARVLAAVEAFALGDIEGSE